MSNHDDPLVAVINDEKATTHDDDDDEVLKLAKAIVTSAVLATTADAIVLAKAVLEQNFKLKIAAVNLKTAQSISAVWERCAKNLEEQLRAALERACADTDYCYACEAHPSHGHRDDCPLRKAAPKDPS